MSKREIGADIKTSFERAKRAVEISWGVCPYRGSCIDAWATGREVIIASPGKLEIHQLGIGIDGPHINESILQADLRARVVPYHIIDVLIVRPGWTKLTYASQGAARDAIVDNDVVGN